ncbi:DNA-directed RNA polymerase III subunit rpc4-like [Heracleum sosnowskyi]|uniref:DNA-directed RNA polymerase III subunit rpc4-like n=1 Tax=Heracleum sosnowskyi TaxID=360622 RepID=A0AAD8J8X3_9APIA|nr:DNA-directed RNA polymerase III subunit rpc4-like [Heracleum sosnowskyi]
MDNDGSPSKSNARKVRFAPKGPPPRRKLAVAPKTEEETDERDEEAAQALFRRVNERRGRREPKVDKKSSVHVAFGGRSETSTFLTKWGKPKEGSVSKTEDLVLQDPVRGIKEITVSSLSTSVTNETRGGPIVHVDTSHQKIEKNYIEPWDYNHSFYPVTLPLRRPYSGDPEILSEAEFEGGPTKEYDEDLTNSAVELGLLTENKDAQMFFFQLPPNLPLVRSRAGADAADNSKISKSESALRIGREQEVSRSSTPLRDADAVGKAKGKEKVDQGATGISHGVSPALRGMENVGKTMLLRKKTEQLEDLPAGYMGKMLVYKSGAIKLKLGDILYDVSAGSSCIFAQDVAAINTVDKECCFLGEIEKRAIVTPDQSLYDNVIDLT